MQRVETAQTDPKVAFDDEGFWATVIGGAKVFWLSPLTGLRLGSGKALGELGDPLGVTWEGVGRIVGFSNNLSRNASSGLIDAGGRAIAIEVTTALGGDFNAAEIQFKAERYGAIVGQPDVTQTLILNSDDGLTLNGVNVMRTAPWIDMILGSGVQNFGSEYQTAQYRKVGNRVEIRGMVKFPSAIVNPAIWTIPFGFTPAQTQIFPVINHGTSVWRLDVRDKRGTTSDPSVLRLNASPVAGGWCSLAGLWWDTI